MRLLGQFLAVLIVVAVLVHFIWWLAAAVGLIALTVVLLVMSFHLAGRVDARVARRAALAARADEQHAWVLAGGECDVFGEYPCPPW